VVKVVVKKMNYYEKLMAYFTINSFYETFEKVKCAVFHTSRGTSSLPSMNKIRDGMVFFISPLAPELLFKF
jgi:hypothetical protein